MTMTEVAPLDWMMAVVPAPIPIAAMRLFLIFRKSFRMDLPAEVLRPFDIRDMPVTNTTSPTSSSMIDLAISITVGLYQVFSFLLRKDIEVKNSVGLLWYLSKKPAEPDYFVVLQANMFI